MDNDIPVEVKLALLEQEQQMWHNSRYVFEVRARVNKRIGNVEKVVACEKELENCEKALDALAEEVKALQTKNLGA